MSQKIFGDVDLTVHTMKNPTLTRPNGSKYVYDGIVFQVNCQDCETPTQMGIPWSEIRILLDGGLVSGVQRSQNGWVVAIQCQNTAEGCSQVSQISITDEELESHAALEVARRQRNARAGAGMQQQQQMHVPVPRR